MLQAVTLFTTNADMTAICSSELNNREVKEQPLTSLRLDKHSDWLSRSVSDDAAGFTRKLGCKCDRCQKPAATCVSDALSLVGFQILTGCRLSRRRSWKQAERGRFLTSNISEQLCVLTAKHTLTSQQMLSINKSSVKQHVTVMVLQIVYSLTTCLPPGPKVHSWLLLELEGKRTKQEMINIQVSTN